MKEIELRYVAHITTLTSSTKERCLSDANTLRELIDELDRKFKGFREIFIHQETGGLNLNAMIYYSNEGEVPVSVINLDHPIKDKSTVTFW